MQRGTETAGVTGIPPGPDDVLVSFRGVEKTYDGRINVVESLDLDIRRGEFLTLLGPSGSGKTTTLMMLAGFEVPTAGEILLNGRSLASVPAHKRSMGMVFQNYALFPHMTVAENLAYPLRRRGLPKAEIATALQRAVAMVKLTGLEQRYPAQLSGGQQQRVAVARALIFQPTLVLMDEPLGALDKQLREHMQIELKELHRQLGVTFVYVTHDQGEALTMSDRVAVFNDGEIQQIDAVEELYERPSNRFVAGFVGDSTLLAGAAGAAEGRLCELVLPTGERLAGINVNGAEPGQPVVASVRPERIEALLQPPPEGSELSSNIVQAAISDVIYFGDHLRLRCAIAGQAQATVKVALGTAMAPHAGQSVWLRFPSEYLRIYL